MLHLFYFNLSFSLLLFTKRILYIHNGLPLCLNVEPKCYYPGPSLPLEATGRKKLTHPLPKSGHSRRHCKTNGHFILLPYSLP